MIAQGYALWSLENENECGILASKTFYRFTAFAKDLVPWFFGDMQNGLVGLKLANLKGNLSLSLIKCC